MSLTLHLWRGPHYTSTRTPDKVLRASVLGSILFIFVHLVYWTVAQMLSLFQHNPQGVIIVNSHPCPLPKSLCYCRSQFRTVKSSFFYLSNLMLHNLGPPYYKAPFLTLSYSLPTAGQNACKCLCHFVLLFAHALSAWLGLPLPFSSDACGAIEIE